MKVVGYVRVSTEAQAQEGVSLDAQRERISAWAVAHGAQLVGIFGDEGFSGGKMTGRDGLASALESACHNRAAIVVYSLTRLARSTADAIHIFNRLRECDAHIVCLSEGINTTTSAGSVIFKLMSVLAEYERDQIVERTKMALDHKRRMGEALGNIPFGFRRGPAGELLRDENEQRALALILRMGHPTLCSAWPASYGKIAAALHRERLSPRPARWTARRVQRVREGVEASDARERVLLAQGTDAEVARELNRDGVSAGPGEWRKTTIRRVIQSYLAPERLAELGLVAQP